MWVKGLELTFRVEFCLRLQPPANIRLAWNWLVKTNTLAYYNTDLIASVKKFYNTGHPEQQTYWETNQQNNDRRIQNGVVLGHTER
jgi:hypothetical protein